MSTTQSDDQNSKLLDPEKEAQRRPSLEGTYICKYVQKEVDFAYHYAQTNIWQWNFKKERLFSKIVTELNRDSPRFKSWMESNGFLLNTYVPGKKLIAIKGVFKDKKSNYYCYNSTHLFLVLLSSLYRHGDLDHFRN